VLVRVSWDEGWHATQDGRRLPVSRNEDGFIALPAVPAPRTRILLAYAGTTEQRVAAGISLMAVAAVLLLASRFPTRRFLPSHARRFRRSRHYNIDGD
jgi:uncharacterized membrane protein YfhO